MAKFMINAKISGLQPVEVEADFYKQEDDYFVFKKKGPRTVFIIDKKYVGSVLTEEDNTQA